MSKTRGKAETAQVTLRAHHSAPARVELVRTPLPERLFRSVLCLLLFWGPIPLLIWIPPHYPWLIGAFAGGLFFAHRNWTGRYRVLYFSAICPRCGGVLSLGVDRAISLPHTLTCYRCHFEPRLELRPSSDPPDAEPGLMHGSPECVGRWGDRWLADDRFVVCDRCSAHALATASVLKQAEAENERAALLDRLTAEGGPLI